MTDSETSTHGLSSSECELESVRYSVVVPFYNEAGAVATLIGEIGAVMQKLGEDWELIAINDGSADATGKILSDLAAANKNIRVLDYSINCGQGAALWSGLQVAVGERIITLDGDGQSDPADIPAMLQKLDECGRNMIVGIRAGRKDSWLRKIMSRVANTVRQLFLCDGVSDSGCALKIFDRQIIGALLPMCRLYSFIPALTCAAGFTVTEMPVQHRLRESGQSSYGLLVMLWRPAVDMLGVWWWRKARAKLPTDSDFPSL